RLNRAAKLPREAAELEVLGACLSGVGVQEAMAGGSIDAGLRAAMQRGGAIATGLEIVSRLTASLRDRLTAETYAAFQHAVRVAREEVTHGTHAGLDGLLHATTGLQRLATTVAGVAADGMVRGGGGLFLDLGRRLERAVVTCWSVAAVLSQPPTRIDSALRLTLELCDSELTYRNRYQAALQPAPALDLVLADTGNPRALAFQFGEAAALLEAAGDAGLAWSAADLSDRSCLLVQRVLEAADPAAAAAALPAELLAISGATAQLSDSITRRYFALLPPAQAVGLEVA
ncbi:MAG TPA: alpha-E domain-containing protein, partial [Acetobacteraceae bacterium]|nr:alpha-E domain-containing protein [Acetobacteraceae bacterium]